MSGEVVGRNIFTTDENTGETSKDPDVTPVESEEDSEGTGTILENGVTRRVGL